MWNWLRRLHPGTLAQRKVIPDELWNSTLAGYGFLAPLSASEKDFLRQLCEIFLAEKQFHGAHGFAVTDAMAVAVAAQACLPLLHMAPRTQASSLLRWYDDFVVVVLHPDQVRARREVMDDSGVVHEYHEVLSGEAMERGPVMLNWHDVATADAAALEGCNLVIHEFAHKLDMRDGAADGCPMLPRGFLGAGNGPAARAAWFAVLQPAYDDFREQVIKAERFGAVSPWMDPYAAQSLPEFFAVACEAYFVHRERFAAEFPQLLTLFDAFFRRA